MAGIGEMTTKTAEELNALKEEVETLNKKLAGLTEEELKQVAGGGITVEDWIVQEYEVIL